MEKTRRTIYKCAPNVGCGMSIKPHEERRIVVQNRERDVRRIHRKCYVRILIPAWVADSLSERELAGVEQVVWAFGPDTVEGMLKMTSHDWGEEQVLDAAPWDQKEPLIGEYLRANEIEIYNPETGEQEPRIQHLVAVEGKRDNIAFAWGSFQLDSTLPDHKGHFVRIADTGERRDIGDGKEIRRFSVKCRSCAAPAVG